MADQPNETNAAHEQFRKSPRRPSAGMADHPNERNAPEHHSAERVQRHRRKKARSRPRSLATSAGHSPPSAIHDAKNELITAGGHESPGATMHGSHYTAPPARGRPLPRSNNELTPSSSSSTTGRRDGAGTFNHAREEPQCVDGIPDEGGSRRRHKPDEHGSWRHSRRQSQMALAHRTPSRQRPLQHFEDDYFGSQPMADSALPSGGRSADGFPMVDDALPASPQVQRASSANALGGNTRLVSAMRSGSARDNRRAPLAAAWTERDYGPIRSPPSSVHSPERRVTMHPSTKMKVAQDEPPDGGSHRIALPAEDDDTSLAFMESVPYQISRRLSVRGVDHVAAANPRRSVAEQPRASVPVSPLSPIDHGPLEMVAGISSGRRQSMMVQAAIQHLPKLSEAEALQKRRASMDYRAKALRKTDPDEATRAPSISPSIFVEERQKPLKKLESRLRACRRVRKHLITVAVGVPLILVVIYFARRVRAPVEDGDVVCSSSDCLDHAHQLLQSLNTSADPCTHFHTYVCGSDRSRQEAQLSEALFYAKLVVSSTVRAVASLAPPTAGAQNSATSKAAAAMSACLDQPATQTAEPFVKFMEARRIQWPSVKSSEGMGIIGVLDALMDLIVDWRVVLWFDAKLMYLTEDRLPVVTFGEPGALTMLRMRQVSLLDDAAYADAVRSVSLFLTNGTTELKSSAIEELREDERAIRDAVLSTRVDDQDILLSLHKAHQLYLRNVSLNEWLSVIAKHVKSTSAISLETRILIMKQQSFSRLTSLLGTFSPTRLVNVIGWTVAYVYVWMLNDDFESFGGRTGAVVSADVLCFLAVHESFGIVQASTIFHTTFGTLAQKEYVSALFNSSSTVLLNKLQASDSITNLTKKEAALKIGVHMRSQLFPPLPFTFADQLDILYAVFPSSYDEGATFFETWLKSKQVLQSTLFSPFHDSLLTARYRWQSGSALYLYSVNLVWLAVSALLPPSYLARGSPIMTYSGLGYQIARQLVKVADERGRRLDYSGAEIPWWEQRGKCALEKAATRDEKKAVADIFALDVALAALKDSAASTYEGGLSTLRIKLLERFSPLQLFYISFCNHFCDDPAEGPALCNSVVNASDFAEAFGCQRHSRPTCLFV
ncbi:hypothetical protein HPB50_026223 [Hyalomma asiaticum]|uniref:Uncharacterized protein n=1 Tax=Hyalomma asiaticum TaxID=266040 RepID=A0ACB7SRF6_HYAAI|nr:hypothetical protein HPB50_026223 [Hyalomma asiaticum]